jgi:hypothetical protein
MCVWRMVSSSLLMIPLSGFVFIFVCVLVLSVVYGLAWLGSRRAYIHCVAFGGRMGWGGMGWDV